LFPVPRRILSFYERTRTQLSMGSQLPNSLELTDTSVNDECAKALHA